MSAPLKQALQQFLAAHAALTPVIAGRVYPRLLPQNGARPALTYELVSRDPKFTQDGSSGFSWARVQVVSWGGGQGTSYGSAADLATLARKCLSPSPSDVATYGAGFKGTISYKDTATNQAATIAVEMTLLESEMDLDQDPAGALAIGDVQQAVTQDYKIVFQD